MIFVQWKQRIFSNISFELWDQIGDDDDEEMMKGKVIDFLNPYHVVKNGKEFFLSFMCQRISLLSLKNGNLPSNNMQTSRNS